MQVSKSLISKYAALRYVVRPTETVLDAQRGPVVTKPPVIIKFTGHTASVSDDVWKEIANTPACTGVGGERMIWEAGDPECPVYGGGSAVNVRNGMATGTATPARMEPLEGWDQMTVTEIQAAIKAGRISDASGAIEYESRKGGRRRSTVIKALASMLDARSDDEDAKASSTDTFSAAAPETSE